MKVFEKGFGTTCQCYCIELPDELKVEFRRKVRMYGNFQIYGILRLISLLYGLPFFPIKETLVGLFFLLAALANIWPAWGADFILAS
jgi:hypothetical protein